MDREGGEDGRGQEGGIKSVGTQRWKEGVMEYKDLGRPEVCWTMSYVINLLIKATAI